MTSMTPTRPLTSRSHVVASHEASDILQILQDDSNELPLR